MSDSNSEKRLDIWLHELNIARSRAQAQDWINNGRVQIQDNNGNWIIASKSSQKFSNLRPEKVRILAREIPEMVSRGGDKLWRAIDRIGLEVNGLEVLDLGTSTGGFADCLLRRGASLVWGIDVGRDQLAAELRANSALRLFEGINARNLSLDFFKDQRFDLLVADLSFISLELVLPAAAIALRPGAQALVLVKPQFEAGPEHLAKGGIVRDPLVYSMVEKKITRLAEKLQWTVNEYFQSAIEGGDGNKEFFLWATTGNL